MQDDKELLIVSGLARSGTTWLEGILNAHPDIFLYHEIDDIDARQNHFSLINYKVNQENEDACRAELVKGMARLKDVSAGVSKRKQGARIVGFKTVGRFTHPTVFNWMRSALDFPKTIFILRHPCGYAASNLRFPYLKNVSSQDVIASKKWLIESLGGEVEPGISVERLYGLLWKYGNEHIMDRNIGTEKFFYVVYEDLCREPEAITRKLIDFVGLDMDDKVLAYLRSSTNPKRNIFTKLWSKRFYSTIKDPLVSAQQWKRELSKMQRNEIMAEVEASPLMKLWDI